MFNASADAYDRFMGRYSRPLASSFATFVGVTPGRRVLDVGCGPGALTAELVRIVGADRVAAADPAEPFVAAVRERHPDVDVQVASAEALPFGDGAFDAALAQLVVHFMRDPVMGIGEMRRVTRSGGVVAACVWDFVGDRTPLSAFWRAARELDPDVAGEAHLAGTGPGQLEELFSRAGFEGTEAATVSATVTHPTFEDWWEPFELGVGPAGDHLRTLDAAGIAAVRESSRAILGDGPISIEAIAWAARGRVP